MVMVCDSKATRANVAAMGEKAKVKISRRDKKIKEPDVEQEDIIEAYQKRMPRRGNK